MKKQKRLEKIADTVTRSESRNSALARLNGFWDVFDKDDNVLIVISADPDALASAMAVKRLLRYRVQNVTIGYPNEIRRLNNLEMVKRLKIPIERLHTLKIGDYNRKVLLDSQPPISPVLRKLPLMWSLIIIPSPSSGMHDLLTFGPITGRSPLLWSSTCGPQVLKPSVALATALFYGIKVDTQNFEKNALPADGISFRYLFNIANLQPGAQD